MAEIDDFHWNLSRTFVGLSNSFAIIGILCNFLIVLTTIRTRTMRVTCNVLIAVCATSDIFHQCGTLLVQLPILFGIHVEIESIYCILLMFIPEMGITIGFVCILLIGLDRMVSVIFSIRYRAINKRNYYTVS
ncbi:hypothetical protein PENTCL1PPCAC_29691 [Pristionchus entomophagus]|uniref:G-protein coupled receptors family 1 profile domain-containing protein n=1 Tax=Pristionchus entomophagus TaxID=358040 RepID=A0AAV5ULP8_9BILA|nr:hypothetical protein PENTCL1PPCAC_29691 [Pristionchus entomophagus]